LFFCNTVNAPSFQITYIIDPLKKTDNQKIYNNVQKTFKFLFIEQFETLQTTIVPPRLCEERIARRGKPHPKKLQLQNIFIRRTDCHNQSADWFRNDVGVRKFVRQTEI